MGNNRNFGNIDFVVYYFALLLVEYLVKEPDELIAVEIEPVVSREHAVHILENRNQWRLF